MTTTEEFKKQAIANRRTSVAERMASAIEDYVLVATDPKWLRPKCAQQQRQKEMHERMVHLIEEMMEVATWLSERAPGAPPQ